MQDHYELPSEVIRLDHLNFHYQTGNHIFYNLNFSFFEGGFYFLTGASGSGKTTLLRLLYGDVQPIDGQISVFGKNIGTLSEKEKQLFLQQIGIIFQNGRLLNHLSALDNVALSMKIFGGSEKKAKTYAKELLHWVGLGAQIDNKPDELSDGQKQRVAIARAVVTRPVLLLADEPTGNVDDEAAFKILGLFEELNNLGTTVVMATHNRQIVNSYDYPELQIHQGQLHVVGGHGYTQSQGTF